MRKVITKLLAPSLFLIGAFLFIAVPNVQAAAPAGTMSATALLMKGNQTKPTNPITYYYC